MAYMTADEFRDLPLGVSFKNMKQETVEYLLEVASLNVENFCERVFTSAYYSETWMGDGSNTFLLANYPLLSVQTLQQRDRSSNTVTNGDPTKLLRTESSDKAGILTLDGNDVIASFSPSYEYTVEYMAGFSPVPIAVKHATALWASELMRPDYAGPDGTPAEIVPMTSEQIAELLGPYKRVRIGF